jgi:hypothetical protein
MRDADSVTEKLGTRYVDAALVPASPWLGARKPAKPAIALTRNRDTGEPVLTFRPARGSSVWLWTVRALSNGVWTREILPGELRSHRLAADPERVLVTAVSRTGVESDVATVGALRR